MLYSKSFLVIGKNMALYEFAELGLCSWYIVGPQFHIKDALIWICVQIKRLGTWNKALCPRTTLWFESLCKIYDWFSRSIIKKWGGMKTKCVINKFFLELCLIKKTRTIKYSTTPNKQKCILKLFNERCEQLHTEGLLGLQLLSLRIPHGLWRQVNV